MRKQPAIIPPTALPTTPKTAPKPRPEKAAVVTLRPPTTPAKRVPKAAQTLTPAPAKSTAPKVASGKAVSFAPSKPAPAKAAKATPVKTANTNPIKAAEPITIMAASTRPVPVRIVAETPATSFAGASGNAWRMSSRYAIAYVRNAALAGEMLATEPRYLAKVAMAVYYDRKGKPFAWQFRFDTARWAEVVGRLG